MIGLRIVIMLLTMMALEGSGQEVFGQEKKLGTGVSVSSLGHILTTRNIVKDCSDIAVQTSGFTEDERTVHRASLIAESTVFDLALLKAELPKGRPFSPLLVWENMHVFIPAKDKKVVQSGYLADTDQLDELINISFGYIVDVPGLIESESVPLDSHSLGVTSGRGSGVFDLHGNLIGLVYSSASEGPAFFHGLDAIARFLVDNKIDFNYQIVGKSKPMQGTNSLVYGFVGRVTYMVLCRSND